MCVIALVVIAIMWALSLLGHAIGLTPTWHQLMHRNHVWEHQHYPLVGLRYVGTIAIVIGTLVAVTLLLRAKARRGAAERSRLAAQQTAEQNRLAAERAAEQNRLAAEGAAEWERLAAENEAEQERRNLAAHQAWLSGPPPFLHVPGRFTQNWIVQNVPGLHAGQIPVLLDELRRRGWTDGDIDRRVVPYLSGAA
jgi:hypothetical protein